MKEFGKTHLFEDVYKLKKEALQEIKQLPLSCVQLEKLAKEEAASNREKQQHDKQQEKPKWASFKLFFRNRKEQEIER